MKAIIYDSKTLDESIPKGFNAVKIRIDGGLKSDLSWKEEIETASKYAEQGVKIFWALDLGIYSGLRNPLTHTAQFMSLKLSVEHFRDKLWNQFQEQTIGVSLYQGSADFSQGYIWDKEQESNLQGWLEDRFTDIHTLNGDLSSEFLQFSHVTHQGLSENKIGLQLLQLYCRDVAAEYLDLLANKLPEELAAFLLLDCTPFNDPVHLANILSKDHFPHLILATKGNLLSFKEFSWGDMHYQTGFLGTIPPSSPDKTPAKSAVCLPSLSFFKPSNYKNLRTVFESLVQRKSRFKVIPEEKLTEEWGGLDYLIVSPLDLTSQGKRMLMGFCAAGGTIVNVGHPMDLPYEISFEDYLNLE